MPRTFHSRIRKKIFTSRRVVKKVDRNWIRNSRRGSGQFSSPRRFLGTTSKIVSPIKIEPPGKNNRRDSLYYQEQTRDLNCITHVNCLSHRRETVPSLLLNRSYGETANLVCLKESTGLFDP
jgi:hypothetical protein